ncbi:uncharacterized protein HMPREF1541_01551 [Cyphellophora europaea CBS 101466]|uniref:Calcofluor white hypersensitive protein n=1 Tax=Cyphellophora europaea (strain CBS 101466) TaxID=1220924 RepID=W2S168_CYPE1|nr:uncharacterized protein HMPREF1541_01551 [Cyphellophora europaea CBS 101466]ETN42397.1 hypothetical protein HMPREF1541_01551 [Cyphellophora europaea CBS 101466]
MSRRGIQLLGVAAAGGVGYYLYNAGGDPKVAQKKMEADASKASAKFKDEIPGRTKEAEKKAETLSQQASSQLDKASKDTKSALSDAEARAKEYKEKTGKELNTAIDKFDKTVEDKAAQAKSGISSWFGGK